jgi:hypothetical protein
MSQHVDRSRVDLNIGLFSPHGSLQIAAKEVFASDDDETDGIAPIGFEIEKSEIDRIVTAILTLLKNKNGCNYVTPNAFTQWLADMGAFYHDS